MENRLTVKKVKEYWFYYNIHFLKEYVLWPIREKKYFTKSKNVNTEISWNELLNFFIECLLITFNFSHNVNLG